MALNFPFDMFMQAQEAKNRNRLQMNQDIAGLGQGLGQGFNTIGQAMKEAQQKKMIEQLLKQTSGQASPDIPTAGMPGPGGVPISSAPQDSSPGQGYDPVLQTILPFIQNDPSMMKEVLPAMVKGEYRQHATKSGMNPYQEASLKQRGDEFKQRMEAQQNIQSFNEEMKRMIVGLRKKGLNTMANSVEQRRQEWMAQHFILGGLGMGPQTPTAGTDGWDATPAEDQ